VISNLLVFPGQGPRPPTQRSTPTPVPGVQVKDLDAPEDNLYADRGDREEQTTARSSEDSLAPPEVRNGHSAPGQGGEPVGRLEGSDAGRESRARVEREAEPAVAGKHTRTPQDEGVLSEVALQAGG